MEQPSADAIAKALAFANGLRKNTVTAGKRWAQWPGGADDLAVVIGCIDAIRQRLSSAAGSDEGAPLVAGCIADLRAVLEWTTYQTSSLATARAVVFARKTRTYAERFGLLEAGAPSLAVLVDSEHSLIENIRTKNGYMEALAARHAHLALPPPLIDVEHLARSN